MFKKNLGSEISYYLENDIIPNSLNFKLEEKDNLDWDKLFYDDYKTPEYFQKKFPIGWEYINGFDEVFEHMAINSLSPSEEIELRKQEAINKKLDEDKKNSEWEPIENFDHIFKNLKSNDE